MTNTQNDSNPFAAPQAQVRKEGGGRPPLATLSQRFGGKAIDQLLPLAIGLVILISTGDLTTLMESGDAENPYAMMSGAGLALTGISSLVFMLVQLYLVLKDRQTIGKRIAGSRVHRTSGEWVEPARYILLRGLVPGILYVIPILGLLLAIVGHLTIFGANRRCLHDYIADTVVLKA